MISQTVEYALRTIVTLAQNEGQPCTARRISELTQVPGPYLSKMLQSLAKSGLVRSQRGLHGGFVLVKKPKQLRISDVVEAVEPIQRIRTCPLDLASHGTKLCPLHRRLDNALAMVEKSFRETTLAELLAEPDSVTPLCETPEVAKSKDKPDKKRRAKKKTSRNSGKS